MQNVGRIRGEIAFPSATESSMDLGNVQLGFRLLLLGLSSKSLAGLRRVMVAEVGIGRDLY